MRFSFVLACGAALALSACAEPVPKIAYDTPQPAHLVPSPPAPVQVVTLPEPLPLPGQLKKLPPASASRVPAQPANPIIRVAQANAAARINPTRDGYIKEPLNSAIFAAASVGRTAFGGLAPEIHGDFRLSEASSALFRDAGQTPPPNLTRPV